MKQRPSHLLRAAACVFASAAAFAPSAHAQPSVIALPPPGLTDWKPAGCRTVPADDPVLATRESWRFMHGDASSTDEISRAIGPMVAVDWTAESDTYQPTGPVFDDAGNLYVSPLAPYENVVLMSLDPTDGSRRWSIAGTTGAPPGGSAPIVIDDPDNLGSQRVYLVLYDRAVAVTTDGSVVWDVATGLVQGPDVFDNFVLGANYSPSRDAIVAVTVDGRVVALDRATGASILNAPFSLPGEKSPDLPSAVPPAVLETAEVAWQQLVDLPDGGFGKFIDLILGQGVEVANMFSIDPNTSRIWIVATAPDAEDGIVDGVSEFGAVYGLDIVASGGAFDVVEACHASFAGGSASTPTLRVDGSRVYVGDTTGKLIAVSTTDCSIPWQIDLGFQIVGSIAASSDNGELYASTRDFIFQVLDNGGSASIGWQAVLTGLFENLTPSQSEFNLNLTSIGANGIGFQAGAGLIAADVPFAVATGMGVIDRETGTVRHFTTGVEETVAVLTTAGDGGFYIGNSPVRRALAIGLGLTADPLVGGVSKFAVERHDLLMRDAVCAAFDRAVNADANAGACPDSAKADAGQLLELSRQVRDVAVPAAAAKGEVSPGVASRVIDAVDAADADAGEYIDGTSATGLAAAAADLDSACGLLAPCPAVPRSACRAAEVSTLSLKRKGGTKDKLVWKWAKGASTTESDFADPTTTGDYALCVYSGVAAALEPVATLPAGTSRWTAKPGKGFAFADKDGTLEDGGIAKVTLKAGPEGKALVKLIGKGENLPDPALPMQLPVRVQLINLANDVCFDASYDVSETSKNDEEQYKGKAK